LQIIASVGDQACDNHLAGHGPIRAGELIVVDIFPRRPEDGYWGDMTRTYLKGNVLTVEPGLYYRGLGGCRIEDVVHVVPGGNEKISSAPYRWEIA